MVCRIVAIALAVTTMIAQASAQHVTAQQSDNGVIVKIDGRLFTEYVVRSGTKPILWPILGPTDQAMTRGYPMKPGAGESTDHVHQRSAWFSHGDVNGIDFWTEGPGKTGTIMHREFVKISSGPEAVVVTRNDWLGPDQKKICEDERTLTFGGDANARWFDFAITLKATEGPVKFGDTKEGTLGLRVAQPLTVDAKRGGRIVNSEGQTDEAAWGKPARWVDYHGSLDGQAVGIAILNHPSSLQFPTRWHVRTYGLFAANPFALRSLTNHLAADGSYTLAAGKTVSLRYRVILHQGDEKDACIADLYSAYAK